MIYGCLNDLNGYPKHFISKFNIMSVGQLQFLSDVLSPSWVDFNLVGHQWASEESVPEVWSNHSCSLVESFHSALTALDVLSILQQLLVDLVDGWRVSLHLPNSENPKRNETDSHGLWHGGEVSDCLPVNVTGWVLNESEKVLEPSLLVGSVDTLLAESVFFEFPIVLFSDWSDVIKNEYL